MTWPRGPAFSSRGFSGAGERPRATARDRAGFPGASDGERRGREAVCDGWHLCETPEDIEEQEALVDRYAERNPGTADRSDAAIARGMLKLVRRSVERYGKPW